MKQLKLKNDEKYVLRQDKANSLFITMKNFLMILKMRDMLLFFAMLITPILFGQIVPMSNNFNQNIVWEKVYTDRNQVQQTRSYYIDANRGNDNNDGTLNSPWQSLAKVSTTTFLPGDNIYFKRGTSYNGSVTINGNGTQNSPITVGAYGTGNAPRFTNPNYAVSKGNAMRIRGDFQIVENLYFHHTAPAPSNASSFEEVWEIGALHISLGNDHVIIRNNEFANVPKAIQSYSQNSLITANYIHDANMDQENGFLQNPYWGPIGIQLGIGNQEVSHNRIENMYAVGGAFVADGGAIEIDDGRNHKDNINIHHNKTEHNMGFLEVSYWDDIAFRESNNIVVEYNLSRDYQSFLLWWAPTHNSSVKNNTIIRDDNEVKGNWNAVFIIDAPPGDINLTKNIVVVDNDQTEAIFIQGFDGGIKDVTHTNNCYWNVDGGTINLGLARQSSEIFTDPLFINYKDKNYFLQTNSPAIGWGAFGVMETEVDADGDGYNATVDCDDTNANINPNQTEIPYNGIDDDCNPTTRDNDLDRDGFNNLQDCDDNNAQVNPRQTEISYNGIDDDCNSATPDDDLDQDGFGIADDCNDSNSNIYPGASEIPDNGIDEDCNGQDSISVVDNVDQDQTEQMDEEEETPTNAGGCATITENLTSSSIGNNNAFIYTPQPNGAINNQFRYRPRGGNSWIFTSITTNHYRYLSGLQAGTEYEFQVSQSCGDNTFSDFSTSSYFNDCERISTEQLFVTSLGTSMVYVYTPQPFGAINNQFRYRPIGTSNWNVTDINTLYPVFSELVFQSDQPFVTDAMARIYSISGQLIKEIPLQEGVFKIAIDVNNFQSGIYLLEYRTMELRRTIKFIKR